MTERAQKIMEAYEAEDTYNFPKDGVVAAIRAVADRFATDWGELQHPDDELIEKFVEKKKEVNDKLIENVLKWSDKVLDGIDLNEKLPDEEND